jgi:septum formation protein
LLVDAGIEPIVVAADVDERSIAQPLQDQGAAPGDVARHLAEAKAAAVSAARPDDLVLAADQVLDCDGRLFTKPADRAEAAAQLAALAGRAHRLHSAFCLMRGGIIRAEGAGVAHLAMRPFGRDFVDLYLATAGDGVLGSVGAYQLEGLGAHLFERIDGDFATILGLPLLPVLAALRREGAVAG